MAQSKIERIVIMKMFLALATLGLSVTLAGCGTLGKGMTDSATDKNLNADGYLMIGVVETNNADTATPQGKLVIGCVTYNSRKVGIPADQKVPTTGYFKATKSKSLFGTEESIVEYDFTAGSDAEAARALETLEAQRTAAMEAKNQPTDDAEATPETVTSR